MVHVAVRDNMAIFQVRGWSKIWALRSKVVVPLSAIRAVRRAPAGVGLGWWKGWRVPGTHLPGVIVAGRYYRDGGWEFWDVRGAGDHAIEIELTGAAFRRLVVDVPDPDAEIARLRSVAPTSIPVSRGRE